MLDAGRVFEVDEPYVPNENGPATLEENEVFDSQYLWTIKEAKDAQENQVYRLNIRCGHDGMQRMSMYISPQQLSDLGELFTSLTNEDE